MFAYALVVVIGIWLLRRLPAGLMIHTAWERAEDDWVALANHFGKAIHSALRLLMSLPAACAFTIANALMLLRKWIETAEESNVFSIIRPPRR